MPLIRALLVAVALVIVGCGGKSSDGGSSSASSACKSVASANNQGACGVIYTQALKACSENKAGNLIPLGTDCSGAAAAAVSSAASRLVGSGATPASSAGTASVGNRLSGSSIERLIAGELDKRGHPGDHIVCPDVDDRVGVKFVCAVTGDAKFTQINGSVADGDKVNLDGAS